MIKKAEKTSMVVRVKRAHDFGNGSIAFDMVANDVTIYGCRYMEKDGKGSIWFPHYKGKDGKYWNYVNFEIDSALLEDIEKQISDML